MATVPDLSMPDVPELTAEVGIDRFAECLKGFVWFERVLQ